MPPPFIPPQPPKVLPNLVLTGIADFSTAKWVFVSRSDSNRPPKNYTLTSHQTQGGLQLIDVNAKLATATVVVDGTETVTLRLPAPTNSPAKPSPPPPFSGARLTRR